MSSMTPLEKIIHDTMHSEGDNSAELFTTIFGICITMKAHSILELGCGGSTYPLAVGASITDGILTSVDTEYRFPYCPEEFEKYWRFFQMDALDFLTENMDKYFDLVFIDDNHARNHVKKELSLLDKMTDEKSVILLHDLMGQNHQPAYWQSKEMGGPWADGGVCRAVFELDRNKWEWATIPRNNGLTILRKWKLVKD